MRDDQGHSDGEDKDGDDRNGGEEEESEGAPKDKSEEEESEDAPKDKDHDDSSSLSDGIVPPAPPSPNSSPSNLPGPSQQFRATPAPHPSIHPPSDSETSGVSTSGNKSRGNPSHGAESRTDPAHSDGSSAAPAAPIGDDVEPAADPIDDIESSPAPADSVKPANSQPSRSMYRTLSESSHICPSSNSSQPFTPDPFAVREPSSQYNRTRPLPQANSSDNRYKETIAGFNNLAVGSANNARPDKGKSPAHAKPRGGLNINTLQKCDPFLVLLFLPLTHFHFSF